MDILHGDSPALGTGHRFFGDEDDVPRLEGGGDIFFHNIQYVVLIGDDMGADAQPAVIGPIHGDDFMFAVVDKVTHRDSTSRIPRSSGLLIGFKIVPVWRSAHTRR